MLAARRRAEWGRTAELLAMIYNCNHERPISAKRFLASLIPREEASPRGT